MNPQDVQTNQPNVVAPSVTMTTPAPSIVEAKANYQRALMVRTVESILLVVIIIAAINISATSIKLLGFAIAFLVAGLDRMVFQRRYYEARIAYNAARNINLPSVVNQIDSGANTARTFILGPILILIALFSLIIAFASNSW